MEPSPGKETTRSQYQEPVRGSHEKAWNGCDFLERSDRSVKKEAIEERRRKAGKKKGPIKCVVRLIERKACHECEKVRGISSGGAG